MSTLTYARLTSRTERTTRGLAPKSHDAALGAMSLGEDLVTEMGEYQRSAYEVDRARLWALIEGDNAHAPQP